MLLAFSACSTTSSVTDSWLMVVLRRALHRAQVQPFFCSYLHLLLPGDGQVDFDEFMTILGPKLVSSEGRDGFLGNTIDSIFWQVSKNIFFFRVKIRFDSGWKPCIDF